MYKTKDVGRLKIRTKGNKLTAEQAIKKLAEMAVEENRGIQQVVVDAVDGDSILTLMRGALSRKDDTINRQAEDISVLSNENLALERRCREAESEAGDNERKADHWRAMYLGLQRLYVNQVNEGPVERTDEQSPMIRALHRAQGFGANGYRQETPAK